MLKNVGTIWKNIRIHEERRRIMAEQQFTASLSRSQGRSAWCLIFRHPLRKDGQGRVGLRVRRGLGTSDLLEAERLKDQMNELLSHQEWWTPVARERECGTFL